MRKEGTKKIIRKKDEKWKNLRMGTKKKIN